MTNTWGGRRVGAGRKKSSQFVSHEARPQFFPRSTPLALSLRLRRVWPGFQDPQVFLAFAKGAQRAKRFKFRVIEFLALDRRLELLVEADTREALESGTKSLTTTLAIAIKKRTKELGKSAPPGPVFLGRFMMTVIDDTRTLNATLTQWVTDESWTESRFASAGIRDRKVLRIQTGPQTTLHESLINALTASPRTPILKVLKAPRSRTPKDGPSTVDCS